MLTIALSKGRILDDTLPLLAEFTADPGTAAGRASVADFDARHR